jgi:hypothetical protein
MLFCDEDSLPVGRNLEVVKMVDVLLEGDELAIPTIDLPHAKHVACSKDDALVLKAFQLQIGRLQH